MTCYHSFLNGIIVESVNLIDVKIENYYHHDGKLLGFYKKSTFQNTEEKALYYKKQRILIYLAKTASNSIFNTKIVDLDESWLNR